MAIDKKLASSLYAEAKGLEQTEHPEHWRAGSIKIMREVADVLTAATPPSEPGLLTDRALSSYRALAHKALADASTISGRNHTLARSVLALAREIDLLTNELIRVGHHVTECKLCGQSWFNNKEPEHAEGCRLSLTTPPTATPSAVPDEVRKLKSRNEDLERALWAANELIKHHSDEAARYAIRAEAGESVGMEALPTVKEIEMVGGIFGEIPGPSMWRVQVGDYCTDFEHEQAAKNFHGAIRALPRTSDGWNRDMSKAPRDGTRIIVQNDRGFFAVEWLVTDDRSKPNYCGQAPYDGWMIDNGKRDVTPLRGSRPFAFTIPTPPTEAGHE